MCCLYDCGLFVSLVWTIVVVVFVVWSFGDCVLYSVYLSLLCWLVFCFRVCSFCLGFAVVILIDWRVWFKLL